MPHSVMLFERHPLDAFFAPRNIAVIGATEKAGSVGLAAFSNLRASDFGGKVIPVNTKSPQVLGVPAYRSVKDIPDAIDLAVIITPAPTQTLFPIRTGFPRSGCSDTSLPAS